MDVYNMYLGESGAYSMRTSSYRDYEKFPYGSLERVSNPQKSYYTIVQEKLQRAKSSQKKESCPFCQEQKKRPLIAYMRKRAQEQNGKICEEAEDEDADHHEHHHHEHHGQQLQKQALQQQQQQQKLQAKRTGEAIAIGGRK